MDLTLTTLLATHTGDWGHHWWPLWPLLWIAVIVAVVWFFKRRHWTAARPRTGVERARDILAERYARGEITGEEYRERLAQLQ
jgi:putative membrane protein